MGNKDKDNFESDSSEEERVTPSKRQKTDKDSSSTSSKRDYIKQPIYNIRQTGSVVSGAPHLNSKQREALLKAKKFAIEVSVSIARMKQKVDKMQIVPSQSTTQQRQQALALMCRVYVGSISFELKEDTIRQAFLPFGPIKSINMSWDPVTQKHKGFAFVEYEIPEAAQLALDQMNGAMLGGRNIKVGRPSNMPQAQAVIDEIQEEAKNYNGIYIASIHPDLTEEDVKSVFEAFGGIVSCKLPPSSTHAGHKGFGFIEYTTNQSALEAIASMNLFDLGGQLLRIGRSVTPLNVLVNSSKDTGLPIAAAKTAAAAKAAAAATAKIHIAMDALAHEGSTAVPSIKSQSLSNSSQNDAQSPSNSTTPTEFISKFTSSLAESQSTLSTDELLKIKQEELQKKLLDESESTLQQQESMSIKGQNARHLVMQKLMRPQESKVVILRNMVGPDDVDESLQDEIQDECSKFGVVEKVIIYKETQTDSDDDNYGDIIVKIFVEFSATSEADKACAALNGRFFGGRLVKAESYDQQQWNYNDFSN